MTDYTTHKRSRWIAAGLCSRCGEVAEQGKKKCSSCLQVAALRRRERTQRLRETNLCIDCGLHPGNGGVRCQPCREAHNRAQLGRSRTWSDERLSRIQSQGGLCAVCRQPMDAAYLDHSHTSGIIREALCFGCNIGLGMFADDPERLRAGAAYLEKWAAATPGFTEKRSTGAGALAQANLPL